MDVHHRGDVSARAAVVNGVAYFPDWGGNLWAVKTDTGRLLWSHQFSDYGLPANTHSRSTPAIDGDDMYIGTQEGAWLLKIDVKTGKLDWKMQVETVSPFPILTTSPVVYHGVVYTGVASTEEGVAGFDPSYP